MSELTPCNYCSLERIKARAKKEGRVIVTVIGQNVYVHPPEIKRKDLGPDGPYWVAWFMSLTDHCVC
jgi:hypothetical protein